MYLFSYYFHEFSIVLYNIHKKENNLLHYRCSICHINEAFHRDLDYTDIQLQPLGPFCNRHKITYRMTASP